MAAYQGWGELDEEEVPDGPSSLVRCTLAWVSGIVPSFTWTSIGLP
jgi:hypothetical protein